MECGRVRPMERPGLFCGAAYLPRAGARGKAPHGGVAASSRERSEPRRHTFPVQRRKKCAMMGLFP